MLILALESSAKSASVAVSRDGELLAQYYQNSGLTHSRTLLPMVEDLLKNTELSLGDVDLIAVSHGPGSFTGVRIGVSAALGLAWALDKPAVGVSTLEAMAWQGQSAPPDAVICAVMDARRNEVYNALFRIREGVPFRICEDRAIPLDALENELRGKRIYLVGDGAMLAGRFFRDIEFTVAPEPMQNAWGVARSAALVKLPTEPLRPNYLRLSQAERERKSS